MATTEKPDPYAHLCDIDATYGLDCRLRGRCYVIDCATRQLRTLREAHPDAPENADVFTKAKTNQRNLARAAHCPNAETLFR